MMHGLSDGEIGENLSLWSFFIIGQKLYLAKNKKRRFPTKFRSVIPRGQEEKWKEWQLPDS